MHNISEGWICDETGWFPLWHSKLILPLVQVTTNASNALKSDEMNLSFELAHATRQQLVPIDEGTVDRRTSYCGRVLSDTQSESNLELQASFGLLMDDVRHVLFFVGIQFSLCSFIMGSSIAIALRGVQHRHVHPVAEVESDDL